MATVRQRSATDSLKIFKRSLQHPPLQIELKFHSTYLFLPPVLPKQKLRSSIVAVFPPQSTATANTAPLGRSDEVRQQGVQPRVIRVLRDAELGLDGLRRAQGALFKAGDASDVVGQSPKKNGGSEKNNTPTTKTLKLQKQDRYEHFSRNLLMIVSSVGGKYHVNRYKWKR